ncbi:response regulator transcription factor [Tissierella carlieri]|uniref:Response regulator transcription factor n=1 Tax=Tissierella carlieri TaxID=689904 RepID=A0ABT1SFG3_9FIRM|nr:response regulator transcription factor [Tissierella carlieri]
MVLEDHPEITNFSIIDDTNEAISIIKGVKLDIVLIDINLRNISDEDGLLLAKRILTDIPDTKVVILTGHDLPVYKMEAKKIGARGFVNKNIEPNDLIKILMNINNGNTYFPDDEVLIEELTDSEKDVLQKLCNGYKRKDIAAMLYISERTVSNHIQCIFNKLKVNSAIEAITKGIQLGYVKPQ